MAIRSTVVLALGILVAQGLNAQTTTPREQVLEARAAAAGYAMTVMATLQESLRLRCSLLPGLAGEQSQAAYQLWMDRNAAALKLAAEQLHAMVRMVAEAHGEAAAQQFGQDRIADTAANAARENASLFPGGIADAQTCLAVARLAASGETDILRHPEFGPTLHRIGTDRD